MAENGDSKRLHTRVGVNVQVKVSSQDVDEFVEHFATNISRAGLFIQCRDPKPKGTILLFEIQLKGGKAAIRGKGKVIWMKIPVRLMLVAKWSTNSSTSWDETLT